MVSYLHGRGIDYDVIDYCIQTGRLYESLPYHNCVFVGRDLKGQPRYAALRGTVGDFKGRGPWQRQAVLVHDCGEPQRPRRPPV